MSSFTQGALKYHERGMAVFPARPNKKPRVNWKQYQGERPTRDQVLSWGKRWPQANIGVVTGKISDIMVVDVDGESGHKILGEYLPDSFTTPTARTPSGYWHYWFKYKPGLINKARVLTECDVRTDGGYIIAPPSAGENGRPYAWLNGLDPDSCPTSEMPAPLFNALKNSHGESASTSEHINNRIHSSTRGEQQSNPQQNATNRNKRNISFDKGQRDETLFHIASCLHSGGMHPDNMLKCLEIFGNHCNPPFPKNEIIAKIDSVLSRAGRRSTGLTEDVKEYVSATWGNFSVTDAIQSVTSVTNDDRAKVRVILSRLAKPPGNIIERVEGKNGVYRKIDTDCVAMDLLNAQDQSCGLWLPFSLHKMVEIMPGNIIVVSGEPNAGKTALLLNVARGNLGKFKTHYFNSEMGASELRKRLGKFSTHTIKQWLDGGFHPYERSSNFADVLKPGAGNLNIIDFLELHDNFYEVGGRLAEIHNKLDGAVAVVALQKNRGARTGLGGERSLEKPRLYLTLAPNLLKIVKAKNWATNKNPNNLQTRFNLYQGCELTQDGRWHPVTD